MTTPQPAPANDRAPDACDTRYTCVTCGKDFMQTKLYPFAACESCMDKKYPATPPVGKTPEPWMIAAGREIAANMSLHESAGDSIARVFARHAPPSVAPVDAAKVREIADDIIHEARRGGYGHNVGRDKALEFAVESITALAPYLSAPADASGADGLAEKVARLLHEAWKADEGFTLTADRILSLLRRADAGDTALKKGTK